MAGLNKNLRIGLLALQGAFIAHRRVLDGMGVNTSLVRYPEQLDKIDGIIAPGGESTTMMKILESEGMKEKLVERVRDGMPYFGTCAGAVIAAKEVTNPPQQSLDLIDVTVKRNAYGRQVDSFTAELPSTRLDENPFHAVFIRAPVISRTANGVEILAEYKGDPVAVRLGNVLLSTFHPELSGSDAVHRLFTRMCGGS